MATTQFKLAMSGNGRGVASGSGSSDCISTYFPGDSSGFLNGTGTGFGLHDNQVAYEFSGKGSGLSTQGGGLQSCGGHGHGIAGGYGYGDNTGKGVL